MSMAKRCLAGLVCILFCLTLWGCGGEKDTDGKQLLNTEGMTDAQKAVVITAESFWLRGNRGQYDMSSMNKVGVGSVSRRITKYKAPEDYTVQNRGYTDCSGFAFDVYLNALGVEIIAGSPYTKTYAETMPNRVLREKPNSSGFDQMSEEELKKKEKEFRDTLQPGDIIVYRYTGDTGGHTLVYVGNGMVIHSSGSSYNYDQKKENFEEQGTYLYDSIDMFFNDPESRRYLFNKHIYAIVRPLNAFNGEIPEATVTRMNNMRGIVAEKLATRTYGQTVNVGEEITFTFHLENHNKTKKTLNVTDTVPANTTYVSGAQTVTDNQLSWTVDVPANGTADVSYTVKVTGNGAVKGTGAVDGIAVECPAIKVGNTLDAQERQSIATQAAAASQLSGLERINEIYTKALGKAALEKVTIQEMNAKIFEDWAGDFALYREGELFNLVAPHLYGGRRVAEQEVPSENSNARTRMLTKELMIVGDIILTHEGWYLFTGEGILNAQTGENLPLSWLEPLLTYETFAILRPSLISDL